MNTSQKLMNTKTLFSMFYNEARRLEFFFSFLKLKKVRSTSCKSPKTNCIFAVLQ